MALKYGYHRFTAQECPVTGCVVGVRGECVSESESRVQPQILDPSVEFPTYLKLQVPPDVVVKSLQTFSSIVTAAHEILPSLLVSKESAPTQPVKLATPPEAPKTFGRRAQSKPAMRDSVSQLDMCRQNTTYLMPNDFRRAYSPADGLAVKEPGKKKVQLVQCRVSYTEEDRKQEVIGDSVKNVSSSQPSYRSCVYREVSLRCTRSFVFLDKSLCISLVELEGEGARKPDLYRSTLSVRLSASSCHRSSKDIKPAKKNEGYGKSRAAMLGSNQRDGRESASGHCRGPVSNPKGHKFNRTPPARGVNSKSDDSDTNCLSTTLGLLSFRGPGPSNTKTGTQKRNADEAGSSARRNFRQRQHTFNTGSENSRTRSNQAASEETCKGQKDDCSTEPERVSTLDKTCYYRSQLKANSLEGTPKTLSLKEALELFRPDFISRSQGRLRRLEQRARIRKALQDSNPDLMQGPRGTKVKQKRNCTTPDPLSDNLFKPRERSISSREMQLRSRRIYNMLPEVTKRKEEEKKRAVSQTNRLRVEVFKKRILDHVLQR